MQMTQAEANEILAKYEEFKEVLSRDYNSVGELKENIWTVMLDITERVASLVE
jgi:hypothetical protein